MVSRARVPEGFIGVVAVLAAIWPMTTLLVGGQWLRTVLLILLLQAAIGMAGRALSVAAAVTVAAQVASVLLGTTLSQLGGYLQPSQWTALPGAIGALLQDASDTLSRYAAPAPATPGIVFCLALIVPLAGVVVDALSVTLRMPALTGLPLLALFLMSTSNTGQPLNPIYFALLAGAWLLMLGRGGVQLMRRWSSTEAYSRSPESLQDRFGLGGYTAVARWLGLTTVILAVLVPTVLPHLPPRYLSDGLARSGTGQGTGVGSVGFTDQLDLSQNLRNTSQEPVLRYTTDNPQPPPLRALTMSRYSRGNWVRDDPTRERVGVNGDRLPSPEGLSGQPTVAYRADVLANGVDAPYVAVPWPVRRADFGATSWTYDAASATPRAQDRPDRYTIDYYAVRGDARPTADQLGDATVPPDTLRQDRASAELVNRTTAEVVAAADADFTKATKIQNWLREPRFTYSLTLKPTQTVNGQRLDPISNFLTTRQGYCTQFATAMVMMARGQGIPARLAVGFLPGTSAADSSGQQVYQVRQSDAHAWPELYFPGMGWTRFEPTPSVRTGLPPDYAPNPTEDAGIGAGGGRASEEPADAPSATSAAPDVVAPTADPAAAPQQEPSWWRSSTWWSVLAVLLVGLCGGFVLPLAARWRREQALRQARDQRQQVEAQWSALQSRLEDLGISAPHGQTPRQAEQHYQHQTPLGEEGRAALHRAISTVESVRYAPPGRPAPSMERDAQRVLHDVRSSASWSTRASAALTPRTGRLAIRDGARSVLLAPLRWWDRRSPRS